MSEIQKAIDHLDKIRAERAAAQEQFEEMVEQFARIDGGVLDDNISCAMWIMAVNDDVPSDKQLVFWQGLAALGVATLLRERREHAAA